VTPARTARAVGLSFVAAAWVAVLWMGVLPARAATSPSPSPSPTPTPSAAAAPSPTPTATPAAAAPSPTPTATPKAAPTPTPTPCPSGSAACQQALINDVRTRLGDTMAKALSVQQQLQQSLQQNQEEQQQLWALVTQNQQKLARLDADIAHRDAQLKDTQTRVATERRQLAVLARALYYEPDDLLVRLLSSGNLRQMLDHAGALTAAANRSQSLQERLKKDLSQLREQQQKAQSDREQETKLTAAQTAALQQFEQLKIEQDQLSGKLSGAISDTQAELDKVGTQDPTLASRIADQLQAEEDQIAAAAEQAVWTQAQLWEQLNLSTIQAPVAASAGHSTRYRFIWPNPTGVITQGFGPTTLAIEPALNGYPHFHTGVDIAASAGTAILAADDGVVALVGSGTTGYGNYVVIAHSGGISTLYGHLLGAAVKQGQRVSQGQTIGWEGSTGASTGPHLHFEVRVNNLPVDPIPYLPPGGPSAARI
jgi:murein DD-endopeptidase MepM/ murein hydrolase activator NlpD